MEEKTERKGRHNAMKSASRMMSSYEREQQCLAKQIKRVAVVLRNNHILAFCAVQKRTHILELFQSSMYALPSFSHFSHFAANCMHD